MNAIVAPADAHGSAARSPTSASRAQLATVPHRVGPVPTDADPTPSSAKPEMVDPGAVDPAVTDAAVTDAAMTDAAGIDPDRPDPVTRDAALVRHAAGWLLGFSSAHTRRAYRADLTSWLRFTAEHELNPLAARRAHLDSWARSLQARGLAARTVARRLASVSSFYSYLVTEQCLADSPVTQVRRPAVADHGETPGLTRDELRRLLDAATTHGSPRTVALLALLATTGLRINEALSRDVAHLAYDRGHRLLRLTRKRRTVLTAPVVRALETYLAGRQDGPLLCTSHGRRMSQPEAWRMLRRIAQHAQLDGAATLSPHSLRVAFITGAREAGVPLEDVQDAAGHADPRTTRRYDRGRHSLDRHAAYTVSGWLATDTPPT